MRVRSITAAALAVFSLILVAGCGDKNDEEGATPTVATDNNNPEAMNVQGTPPRPDVPPPGVRKGAGGG